MHIFGKTSEVGILGTARWGEIVFSSYKSNSVYCGSIGVSETRPFGEIWLGFPKEQIMAATLQGRAI